MGRQDSTDEELITLDSLAPQVCREILRLLNRHLAEIDVAPKQAQIESVVIRPNSLTVPAKARKPPVHDTRRALKDGESFGTDLRVELQRFAIQQPVQPKKCYGRLLVLDPLTPPANVVPLCWNCFLVVRSLVRRSLAATAKQLKELGVHAVTPTVEDVLHTFAAYGDQYHHEPTEYRDVTQVSNDISRLKRKLHDRGLPPIIRNNIATQMYLDTHPRNVTFRRPDDGQSLFEPDEVEKTSEESLANVSRISMSPRIGRAKIRPERQGKAEKLGV